MVGAVLGSLLVPLGLACDSLGCSWCFIVCFFAGLLSFLSPCVLPIVPSYLCFLTGSSLEEIRVSDTINSHRPILIRSIFFVLGFSLIFIGLGASATLLRPILNFNIINKMYQAFIQGNDVVVASRFIKGGSMKGCPILKALLVRLASSTLYLFSSIPVKDASNGFRLFSSILLNTVKIESNFGFAYSLDLLA